MGGWFDEKTAQDDLSFTTEDHGEALDGFAEDEDIAALVDDLPSLKALPTVITMLARIPWFTRLGTGDNDRLVPMARAFADTLGFPESWPAFFDDIDEALEAALSLDLNGPAWEAEEAARAALTEDLVAKVGESVFEMIMLLVMRELAPSIEQAAADAQARIGIMDDDFLRAAVGAAIQASHQAVLVALVGDEDHPFMARIALFEAGRWPITIVGSSFLIF